MNIYLDKLELHGFKSFPEKTVIKFHKGITAVIGPNGCGKSNIVDAVLWVLGEQKIKSLRGENSEDLIFNGSENKKPLGMTEVGAYFIKDYEPVYIARRYYRSAETKYILNEKYCRNRDIQNTLYDMRMGEKKYFIFEQGSIDKLVQLKAGEKRILIEEAAGVSQYLERKKETVNKLIIAKQNLENLDMLLFDKEKRLKDLKNQVNYVQRYRTYKLEKLNNLKALIQKKYGAIQKEVKNNLRLKDDFINKETVLIRDINKIEKELLELEEKKWSIDQTQKKLEKIKFDTNSSIITARKEIENNKREKDFTIQRISDLKMEKQNNLQELNKLTPTIENFENELNEYEIKLKTDNEKFKKIEKEIESSKKDYENYIDENKKLKSEVFSIQSEISNQRNHLNKLERTKLLEESQIKNKNKDLEEINIDNFEKVLKEKKNIIERLESEVVNIKERLISLIENRNIQYEKIKTNEKDINEIENEISSLQKQREKYSEIKNKISGIDKLDENNRANLPLQDLLISSEENFKIIESYFFDELDAFFLQDNVLPAKLNRKYIIINGKNIKPNDDEKKNIMNEKGFISFISEVYKIENPKYKNSLKEGIIVDTLENGIEIFKKYGCGVVTKDSLIINNNGLIIKNRDKGILNINKEIKNAENNIKILEEKLIKYKHKLSELNEIYKRTNSSVEKEQTIAKVSEKELIEKSSEYESLLREKERNKKRADLLKSEINLSKENIDTLNVELDKINKKLKDLNTREKEFIEKLENYNKNTELKKQKINDIEKKYLEHRNALNLLKERINSLKSKISNQKNTKNRLVDQNKNKTKQIEEFSKKNNKLDISTEILEEELKKLGEKIKINETSLNEKGNSSNELGKKIKYNNESLNTLREQLSEIKSKKNEIEIMLSGYKKDIFQLEELALKELNDELKNIKGKEEYLNKDLSLLENEVSKFDEKLFKMSDSDKLNFSAESEYEILYKAQGAMITQKEDVIKSIEDMHNAIEKIDSESKVSFLKAFNDIKEKFVENFKILFEGGDATLKLTDESNLLETGLDIKAQPPGKQLLSLRLLSGGEKTLTSLAFLFALFQYKPAPFCIFDEVDASLDEANIQRFLKFLHTLKKNTQFLIITHNFKTMEEADYLYGISMNEPGISTIYSTKFSDQK